MKVWDFFNNIQTNFFIPKTPFAAIKAFEAGLLPVEHFIYKSTSTMALGEGMVELEEIERVLAKTNLSLYANLLLMEVLEHLLADRDTEVALFAAESINLIEERYNKRIEALKQKKKDTGETQWDLQIGEQYYELGLLNHKKKSIKKFYFKESLYYMKQSMDQDSINFKYINITIKMLIELRKFDSAMEIIHNLNLKDKQQFLFLEAEVEFKRKNYIRVFQLIKEIEARGEYLDDKWSNICTYWTDNQWIEKSKSV